MKNVYEIIDNCLLKYKPGSLEFCKCARGLVLLKDKCYIDISKDYFDKFLTTEDIKCIGDYISFLNYYLTIFNTNEKVTSVIENLLMNKILPLNIYDKKYIEDEILIIKKYSVCDKLTKHIIAELQGIEEPYILHKKMSWDICGDIFNTTKSLLWRTFKYYPF